MAKSTFTDPELLRYSRHILLSQLDVDGQLAIANATVLVVGAGGLGAPVAQYLAAAGVGRLLLADHDRVELSNLQRQVIHNEQSLELLKVESAARAIGLLNPGVEVEPIAQLLQGPELDALVARMLPHADPVRKVSIVARGMAGGYTLCASGQVLARKVCARVLPIGEHGTKQLALCPPLRVDWFLCISRDQ